MTIFFINPSGNLPKTGGVFLKGNAVSDNMVSLKSDNRTEPVGPVDNKDSDRIKPSIKFANDVSSFSQKTSDSLNASSYDNIRKSVHSSTSDRLTANANYNPITNKDSIYKRTGKVSFGSDLSSNSVFFNHGSNIIERQSDDNANEEGCPEVYEYSSKPGVFGIPIVTATKINTPPCSTPLCLYLENPPRYIKLQDLPVGQTFMTGNGFKYIKIEGEYNAQQLDDFDQPIEGVFENIDPRTEVANPDRCAKWVCKDKDENGNLISCKPDEPEDCRDNLGNNTYSECLGECIDYGNHCKHLDSIAGKSIPGLNTWREDFCTCWCGGSEDAKQACLDLGYDDVFKPDATDYKSFLETGIVIGTEDKTTCECECDFNKRYDTELKRCVDIVTKGACCYILTSSDGVKTRECGFMDQSTCVAKIGTFYPNKGCKDINYCENCYTDDDSKKINLCDTGEFDGQCIECESNEYFVVHNGECQCMTCSELISNGINLCYSDTDNGFYGDMYEDTSTLDDDTQITVCRCCEQNTQYKDCLKNTSAFSPCAFNCGDIGSIEDGALVWDEEKCECVCPEGSSNPTCQMINNDQYIIDPETCQCICPDSIRQSCLERGFAFYSEDYFDENDEISRLKRCTCDCGSNPTESEKLDSCPAEVYDLENCMCHCDKLGPGGEPLFPLQEGHVYSPNCSSVCPQQLELGYGPRQLPPCPNREDGAEGYFNTSSCECEYPCDPGYYTIFCPGYSMTPQTSEDHVFCVECENKDYITPCSMVDINAAYPYNTPRCNPIGTYCKISDSYEGYCVSNDYSNYKTDNDLGITFGGFYETQYCDGDGRLPILDCSYTTEPPTTTPIFTTTMAPDRGACCYRVRGGDWQCEDNKTARGCEIIGRDVGAVDIKFALGEYCSEEPCASPLEYGACYKINTNYLGRCISCIDNVVEAYCNEILGTSFFAEEQCSEERKTELLKETLGCRDNQIVDLDTCKCINPPPPSGCNATWYAQWNCDSEDWEWYGSAEASKWCGEEPYATNEWTYATVNTSGNATVTSCIQTYTIFSPGDCTKDSDCSDIQILTTPSFPEGVPETSDYNSCCPPVCTYILSTSYDCDSEEWSSPTLIEAECLERSPPSGLYPVVYDEWTGLPQTFGVPVDQCVRIMRRKSSECDENSPCLNYILVFGEAPSDMATPDYIPDSCCEGSGGSSGGDSQAFLSKSYIYDKINHQWIKK